MQGLYDIFTHCHRGQNPSIEREISCREFRVWARENGIIEFDLETYAKEREIFAYYMDNLPELEKKLQEGAEKTKKVAQETLQRVRKSLGM